MENNNIKINKSKKSKSPLRRRKVISILDKREFYKVFKEENQKTEQLSKFIDSLNKIKKDDSRNLRDLITSKKARNELDKKVKSTINLLIKLCPILKIQEEDLSNPSVFELKKASLLRLYTFYNRIESNQRMLLTLVTKEKVELLKRKGLETNLLRIIEKMRNKPKLLRDYFDNFKKIYFDSDPPLTWQQAFYELVNRNPTSKALKKTTFPSFYSYYKMKQPAKKR